MHAGLSPARRERFAQEIKLLAKLRHPCIARLYDAGSLEDGTPWFVMDTSSKARGSTPIATTTDILPRSALRSSAQSARRCSTHRVKA